MCAASAWACSPIFRSIVWKVSESTIREILAAQRQRCRDHLHDNRDQKAEHRHDDGEADENIKAL
jgi:hypothetical protein